MVDAVNVRISKRLRPIDRETLSLGLRFRDCREKRKISLRDLSEKTGLSVNTLRAHEAGAKPLRVHHLRAAARAMGCGPSTLVRGFGGE